MGYTMKVLVLSVALLCSAAFSSGAEVVCGPNDIIVPNPEDCSSFYACDNGVPILSNCPPNLFFNPTLLVCDRPENVNCEGASNPTTSNPTNAPTVAPPTGTTEGPVENACPSRGSAIIANPKSCTSFLVCINGDSVQVDCPTGMEFNPQISRCDLDANVICEIDENTEAPTPEPTDSETDTPTDAPTDAVTDEETDAPTDNPTDDVTEAETEAPTDDPTDAVTDEETEAPTDNPTDAVTDEETDAPTEDPTDAPTEQPPVGDSGCPATGSVIIANPSTCSSFLVCINGNSVAVPCPPGFLFDSEALACDLASNVDCNLVTESPTDGPSDVTDDSTDSATDDWTDAETDDSTDSATDDWTDAETDDSTDAETNAPTEGETESPTEKPGSRPECPDEGYSIIPNPDDCSSFYVCINGLSALINCSEGLDFDVTTNTCEEPEIAQCRKETTTLPPTTPEPYVPPCPPQGVIELENPSDCGSFYVCIDGLYTKLECPEDLEFSASKQTCVNPAQANCSKIIFNLSSDEKAFECQKDGSFPNPDDCGSYYVCLSGEPILMQCPGGLQFDPTSLTCNTPDVVQCSVGSSTETTPSTTSDPNETTGTYSSTTSTSTGTTSTTQETTTGSGPNCPAEGTEVIPNPDDCGSFYVCIEGDYGLVECPPDYGFNPDLGNCDPDYVCEDDSTSAPPTGDVECPSSGISKVPNPFDCASYYFCVNGQPALITCPNGLFFNEKTGSCDATVICTISTTPKPDTTSTPKPTQSTSTGNPGSSTTSDPDSTATPPAGQCSVEGQLFPNPNDCSTFFQCANGILVEQVCPPGLEFSPEHLYCDHPDLANCESNYSVKNFLRFWH